MSASSVLAHVGNESTLVETISKNSFSFVTIGGFLISFLVILASLYPKSSEAFKISVFVLITIISLGITFYLSGTTIYKNNKSATGGPVHWHADFRIFTCGEELDLIKPTGFFNRIGKTDLHEHGDKRIHVEGVVMDKRDISLSNFFKVIGGNLAYGEFNFPGREKYERFIDGDKCEDGREGKLQVFVYKTEGMEIKQNKIADYPEYVLSGESKIPPGDCIIFEFTPDEKDKTDQICNFTKIAIDKGKFNYIK